jgi:hypothetical protein
MASFELVEVELDIIVKNVKIDKIVFVKRYTPKEWLNLVEECHQSNQEDRKEFILCVYCTCKKISKMRKKGCEKVVDDHGNQLTFKLDPPLRNTIEGNILAKGGKFLEYKAKLEALSKPKHSCPTIMKIVPLM